MRGEKREVIAWDGVQVQGKVKFHWVYPAREVKETFGRLVLPHSPTIQSWKQESMTVWGKRIYK